MAHEAFERAYIITVANARWNHRCTAVALVREAGIPLSIALRWSKVRSEMSPRGLARKIKAQVN